MLYTNYCVPDKKNPPKIGVYCLFFVNISFGEEKIKDQYKANAAFKEQ